MNHENGQYSDAVSENIQKILITQQWETAASITQRTYIRKKSVPSWTNWKRRDRFLVDTLASCEQSTRVICRNLYIINAKNVTSRGKHCISTITVHTWKNRSTYRRLACWRTWKCNRLSTLQSEIVECDYIPDEWHHYNIRCRIEDTPWPRQAKRRARYVLQEDFSDGCVYFELRMDQSKQRSIMQTLSTYPKFDCQIIMNRQHQYNRSRGNKK